MTCELCDEPSGDDAVPVEHPEPETPNVAVVLLHPDCRDVVVGCPVTVGATE